MPHFTIEYSANLDGRVDMGAVVELVRKSAVETGIFPLGGIRVRAIKYEHYAIADGKHNYGFLDMVLRLGEGRDLATRKAAGISRQDLNAPAAAFAARSISSALPRATDASTAPSMGDLVSNVWPDADGTVLPSIMWPMPSAFSLASRGAARSRLA